MPLSLALGETARTFGGDQAYWDVLMRQCARFLPIGLVAFPLTMLGGLAVSTGFRWFSVLWGALLMLAWAPLASLLLTRGWRKAGIALALAGNVWCVPMGFLVLMLGEPAGRVTSESVEELLEHLLVGGGVGLIGGSVGVVWSRRRGGRSVSPFGLPLATALAAVSFYPALYLTPIGPTAAHVRYELSGRAAADRAEAARPVQSLEEQLRIAGPAMSQAFPAGEILMIESGEDDDRRPELGVGLFAIGRPKRWCVVIRDEPGSARTSPYALNGGEFNPRPYSSQVGSCPGGVGPLIPILRTEQAGAWPWIGPEAAVARAEAAGAADFRETQRAKLVRLGIHTDADGRAKWLAQYRAALTVFMQVMIDARTGEVLCAEASSDGTPPTVGCRWAPLPRKSP